MSILVVTFAVTLASPSMSCSTSSMSTYLNEINKKYMLFTRTKAAAGEFYLVSLILSHLVFYLRHNAICC